MTINEQVHESRAAAEAEPGDDPDAPPEWVIVSNKNPGFSINESKNELRNIAFRLWRS
jgi:hypothetical protein